MANREVQTAEGVAVPDEVLDMAALQLAALIEDVARYGTREHLWLLAQDYEPSLVRDARCMVGRSESYLGVSPQDVVHSGIVKVFSRFDTCEKKGEPYPPPGYGYFKSAMLSVIRDTGKNWSTRYTISVGSFFDAEMRESGFSVPDRSAEDVVLAGVDQAIRIVALESLFAKLEPDQHEMLKTLFESGSKWAGNEDGPTYEEIAERLDTTVSAVKSMVYRIRRRALLLRSERTVVLPQDVTD